MSLADAISRADRVTRHFGFGSSEFCLDSLWEDMMRQVSKLEGRTE